MPNMKRFPILRSLIRKEQPTPDFLRARPSSLPFISGDTFRSVAEVIVEGGQIVTRSDVATGVVFGSIGSLKQSDGVKLLTDAAGFLREPNTARLVLHNGDESPTSEELEPLTKVFSHVFAVNVHDGTRQVTPVPIGLENACLNLNGRLHYYLDALENPTSASERSREILSSFHVSNNPAIREHVRNQARASRHGHQEEFFKSRDYRLEVRNSLFVLSPPGNGNDCHRTWEAIYLGAVPVVLKGSLAESLCAYLPILTVNDYSEVLNLETNELRKLYVEIRQTPAHVAFAHHWLGRVLGREKPQG